MTDTTEKAESKNDGVSRRALLRSGGIGILGSTFIGSNLLARQALGLPDGSPDSGETGGVTVSPFQKKPVVLPAAGSRDLVEHARAEMLFWNDQLMEHSLFMAILMPANDLTSFRNEALQFQRTFSDRINRLRRSRIELRGLRAEITYNNDLVKRLIDFKIQTRDLQLSGRIHTLAWPHFLTHVANEAQRFMKRTEDIGQGQVDLDSREVVEFWTAIMGEHAQFISHLLDPEEVALITKADQTAKAFFAAKHSPAKSLESLADEMVNFKEAAENGIVAGKIRSMILPSLADHVRREAVKFVDELKRI